MPPAQPSRNHEPREHRTIDAATGTALLDLLRQNQETQREFMEESRSIRDALQALTVRLERMDGSLVHAVENLVKLDDIIPRVNRLEVQVDNLQKTSEREIDRHDEEDVRAPQDMKWVLSLVLSLLLSSASFLLYLITALSKK